MKKKILLTGNQDAIIDDFFLHTVKSFICMNSSLRMADIRNHIQFFEPDVFVYCVNRDCENNSENILSIKKILVEKESNAIIVVIGDRNDIDMLSQEAVETAEIILFKPLNIKKIQDTIQNKLEDIRIEKEIAEKKRQAELAEKAKLEKKHILLVDDDPVMLRTVKHYLEEKYVVATAPSGKFALKFLEQKHTDLVLLDYEMPEMSGSDVFKQIKENESLKNLPVVFLTGISDVHRIKAVLAMQPNGYLLKPVEYERLHQTITSILG